MSTGFHEMSIPELEGTCMMWASVADAYARQQSLINERMEKCKTIWWAPRFVVAKALDCPNENTRLVNQKAGTYAREMASKCQATLARRLNGQQPDPSTDVLPSAQGFKIDPDAIPEGGTIAPSERNAFVLAAIRTGQLHVFGAEIGAAVATTADLAEFAVIDLPRQIGKGIKVSAEKAIDKVRLALDTAKKSADDLSLGLGVVTAAAVVGAGAFVYLALKRGN